ncbi:putative major sperm protein (MSP) [Helianthus anomalus]
MVVETTFYPMHIIVQVKTTNLKKYCVHLNTGVVSPKSTCEIIGDIFLDDRGVPRSLH